MEPHIDTYEIVSLIKDKYKALTNKPLRRGSFAIICEFFDSIRALCLEFPLSIVEKNKAIEHAAKTFMYSMLLKQDD